MIMNKAYKFRIYTNQAQENLIKKTISCYLYVFNYFLSLSYQSYK
ncbi:helix-turn-helix domain-containing protein, partial [Bacillus cereus]|nr:helix-turn-helix domain-containing protein [Bacillus cereus]